MLRRAALCGLAWLAWIPAAAQSLRINEIVAASSQRLLQYDSEGSPRIGPGISWRDLEFNDGPWRMAPAPFGFGTSNLRTSMAGEMRNTTPSLYLRNVFQIDDNQLLQSAELEFVLRYDDGVILYLNGREVLRRNMGARHGPAFHDQTTYNSTAGPASETVRFSVAQFGLRAGSNVLAAQVHNQSINDGDYYFSAELNWIGRRSQNLIADNDPWRYFPGVVEPSGGLFDLAAPEPISDSNASDPYEADFLDWIEIFNAGDETVSLGGWTLSNDADAPNPWPFPEQELAPGDYVIVAASGREESRSQSGMLHAHFKLNSAGEYLGMRDPSGAVVSEFSEGFPPQDYFHSHGWNTVTQQYEFFTEPTPGRANGTEGLEGRVADPEFSHTAQFSPNPIRVTLSASTPNAEIRYTLNGAEPTQNGGLVYGGPIVVASSAAVRAKAFRPGWIPSKTVTQTYLIDEPAARLTLPALSLAADDQQALYDPHGVTAINGGTYVNSQWQARDPNDYNIPMQRGRPWEKPASLEFVDPVEGALFQTDMGLRISGSNYSRPRYQLTQLRGVWPSSGTQKPSFNFFFRNEYNADFLNYPLFPGSHVQRFDSLRLRAGKNDIRNPFIRDEMMRRLFIDTGQFGSHGIHVNLYVNGQFKGYFNLVERYREEFFQLWHESESDWDVFAVNEVVDGDTLAWNRLRNVMRGRSMDLIANYREAERLVDVDNFIDYLLVNIYGGTWDWPHNNFVMARERSDRGRWGFYIWDAEGAFGQQSNRDASSYNTITQDLISGNLQGENRTIPLVFSALRMSPEFRLRFADRVYRHFFNGGALTDENIQSHFDRLAAEIAPMIQHVQGQTFDAQRTQDWINRRRPSVLNHLRRAGLWPTLMPPELSHAEGIVPGGVPVELIPGTSLEAIYYTLDGSDPRNPEGGVHGMAYDQPIPIVAPVVLKARSLRNDQWSALAEAAFQPESTPEIIVSEIYYNPSGPEEDLEFLELYNAGPVELDLLGYFFSDGIEFRFEASTPLAPGAFLTLIANPDIFAQAYPDVPIGGVYDGRLDNAGERLALNDLFGNEFFSVEYKDEDGWPAKADGEGESLVLIELRSGQDFNSPSVWKAGGVSGGTPGKPEGLVYWTWVQNHFTAQEIAAENITQPWNDADGDGWENLVEYGLDMNPKIPEATCPGLQFQWSPDNAGFKIQWNFPADRTDLRYELARSNDAKTWQSLNENLAPNPLTSSGELEFPIANTSEFFTVRIRWKHEESFTP